MIWDVILIALGARIGWWLGEVLAQTTDGFIQGFINEIRKKK